MSEIKSMEIMMRRLLLLLVALLFVSLDGERVLSSGEGVEEGVDLYYDYYKKTCPHAERIVKRMVQIAVLKEPRMAASLLRLHFHDCFVMGCDASVLLDDHGDIISEKQALPNVNSLRGFKVIDKIKYLLEEACPHTVSCADILALAARDAVVLRSGPTWKVLLGRKDSLKASLDGANKYIPSPNSSLEGLIDNFKQQGLDIKDLVTLSGSHTMGKARCLSFRQRVYDIGPEEYYDKYKRYRSFRRILQSICPKYGRDDQRTPLDFTTPTRFDNNYYVNLLEGKGLLHSDNVLIKEDHEEGEIIKQVWAYASDQELFFDSFVESIVKMGNIDVITGNEGEIRKNCRFVNSHLIE